MRLAETLAALRDRSLPGLSELNEATQSVFCFGNDLPLRLIHEKLIVGETLGSVPGTGVAMVDEIVAGLIARDCIGLPGACASLNDEAGTAMFDRIVGVNTAIELLQNEEHLAAWRGAMAQLADQRGLHGLVAGRCCRLLLDAGAFTVDDAARRLSVALSTANEPAQMAVDSGRR